MSIWSRKTPNLLKLVLLLFLTWPVVLCGQFNYTTNNGTITITGYTGAGGAVSIPGTINGWPVTSIGSFVFDANSTVTSVVIPDGVTSIGMAAFEECANLTSVNIPSGVLSIGDFAFSSCPKLAGITIPNSVTNIGQYAFDFCDKLTSVTIPNSVIGIGYMAFGECFTLTWIDVGTANPAYSSVGGVLCDKSQTTLIQYPAGRNGTYTVPATIVRIGDGAFHQCQGLTGITLPPGLATIGDDVFYNCAYLPSISIPDSVTNISDRPFLSCIRLGTISVGNLNPAYSSADGVLFNKAQTVVVRCPLTRTGNYVVPDSVLSISDYAFEGCLSISGVTIPNSVTNIGGSAFAGCNSMTNLVLGNNVVRIGDSAFTMCQLLTNVILPDSLASIEDYAFSSCFGLKGITFPNSLTNIGYRSFSFCNGITNVVISANVISIEDYAFESCQQLNAITVDVQNLSYYSVDGVLFDKNQTALIQFPAGKKGRYAIPAGVFSVRNDAFFRCLSLTNITIPYSVTNLGSHTFDYCSNLAGLYFAGNAPKVGSSAFFKANNAVIYYLPGMTGWGSTFSGRPTVLWNPLAETNNASFGVKTNKFGFAISGTSNLTIVVEASTSLTNSVWTALQTNTLSGGLLYFGDSQWTNSSQRFYRFRAP